MRVKRGEGEEGRKGEGRRGREGIGGGTRGAEGATAPPDFKIYAFGPPRFSYKKLIYIS